MTDDPFFARLRQTRAHCAMTGRGHAGQDSRRIQSHSIAPLRTQPTVANAGGWFRPIVAAAAAIALALPSASTSCARTRSRSATRSSRSAWRRDSLSATKTTIVAILVVLLTSPRRDGRCIRLAHDDPARRPWRVAFPHDGHVNRLDRRLDLTDAQRAQVEQIIRRHHARIDGMWDDLRPRMHAEIAQANAEISRILTPEQRAKFERLKFHVGGRSGSPTDRERTGSTR